MHAGRERPTWFDPLAKRLLPLAITRMMPAARAFANAATRASVGSPHGEVLKLSEAPKLMLIARTL